MVDTPEWSITPRTSLRTPARTGSLSFGVPRDPPRSAPSVVIPGSAGRAALLQITGLDALRFSRLLDLYCFFVLYQRGSPLHVRINYLCISILKGCLVLEKRSASRTVLISNFRTIEEVIECYERFRSFATVT